MITSYKSTKPNPNAHIIPGDLPTDNCIEIFADVVNKKVFFKQNGKTYPFNKLPKILKEHLTINLFKDGVAVKQLHGQHQSLDQMLEQYAFCLHGDIDNDADVVNGTLAAPENFRCQSGLKCQCLKWESKNITLDGKKMTFNQIELAVAIASGQPDKVICQALTNPITQSTLDTRKRNLYRFAGVQCKAEFIKKAYQQKIIQ